MKGSRSYTHVFVLPFDRPAVFELFADPRRLDLLTPPWFRLAPLGELPSRLDVGREIPYRLRWRGLPLRWTSVLTDWDEPGYFAYEQRRGPYRFFRHEHFFEPTEGGTEVRDRVVFRGPAGRLADRLLTEPDLRRIFAYRERRALEILGDSASRAQPIGAAGRIESHDAETGAGDRRHGLHRRQAGTPPAGSRLSSPMSGP